MKTKPLTVNLLLLDKSRPDVPMSARLTYNPATNPYAVSLTLRDDQAEATVTAFSRDLLAAGLREPVGAGDVRISPVGDDDWLLIAVRSDDWFEGFVPRDPVTAFLARSFRRVAAGTEHEWIDWDREVARLLAAEQAHRTEIRLWEVQGWRTRMGTLAAALDDTEMVVIQAPTLAGAVMTWRTSKTTLAAQTAQAHSGDGWVRLDIPGDETMLVQADAVDAFLSALLGGAS